MKKRLFALALALVMMLSLGLAACKPNDDDDDATPVWSVTIGGGASAHTLTEAEVTSGYTTPAFTATVKKDDVAVTTGFTLAWTVSPTGATIVDTSKVKVTANTTTSYTVKVEVKDGTTVLASKTATLAITKYTAPVAPAEPETTMSAWRGHNGVVYAEVTVDGNGKITDIVLDEVDGYGGVFAWTKAGTDNVNWGSTTLETADLIGAQAKYIRIGNVKFELNASGTLYESKNATADGFDADTQLSFGNNLNAFHDEEVAIWYVEAMRAGEYDVLKADGTAYAIAWTHTVNFTEYAAGKTRYEGEYVSQPENGSELTKENRYIKSLMTYRDRKDANLTNGQLSFAENIDKMIAWVLDTNEGSVLGYTEVLKLTAADALNEVKASGNGSFYYYNNGEDYVSTGATFNDWDYYMLTILNAYLVNPNAIDLKEELPEEITISGPEEIQLGTTQTVVFTADVDAMWSFKTPAPAGVTLLQRGGCTVDGTSKIYGGVLSILNTVFEAATITLVATSLLDDEVVGEFEVELLAADTLVHTGGYTHFYYSNYGAKVDVTVVDGVIAEVALYADAESGWVRTSANNQSSGWELFEETEAGYAALLAKFVGMTPAQVNAIVVGLNAAGGPVSITGTTELVMTGATQSAGRVILAVQNALNNAPAKNYTGHVSVEAEGDRASTLSYLTDGHKVELTVVFNPADDTIVSVEWAGETSAFVTAQDPYGNYFDTMKADFVASVVGKTAQDFAKLSAAPSNSANWGVVITSGATQTQSNFMSSIVKACQEYMNGKALTTADHDVADKTIPYQTANHNIYSTHHSISKAAGFKIWLDNDGKIVSILFTREGAVHSGITGGKSDYIANYNKDLEKLEAALVGMTLEQIAALDFAGMFTDQNIIPESDPEKKYTHLYYINTVLGGEADSIFEVSTNATGSLAGSSKLNALLHLIEWAIEETLGTPIEREEVAVKTVTAKLDVDEVDGTKITGDATDGFTIDIADQTITDKDLVITITFDYYDAVAENVTTDYSGSSDKAVASLDNKIFTITIVKDDLVDGDLTITISNGLDGEAEAELIEFVITITLPGGGV